MIVSRTVFLLVLVYAVISLMVEAVDAPSSSAVAWVASKAAAFSSALRWGRRTVLTGGGRAAGPRRGLRLLVGVVRKCFWLVFSCANSSARFRIGLTGFLGGLTMFSGSRWGWSGVLIHVGGVVVGAVERFRGWRLSGALMSIELIFGLFRFLI